MTEEKINAGVAAAEAAPKRNRRGVSNQTQAVAQLKFHEKDAAPNGLFIGHLEECRVDWSTNADGGAFTGISIPRVTLHFASEHKNAAERRHVYQTIFPQPSNVDTIPGGDKAWQVDNVFNWIKHILDVYYLKGREMTPEEEEALELNFVDYQENGTIIEYVPVDTEKDVVPAYRTLFENFVAMMNGTFNLKEGEVAKPCYKTSDGKFIPAWLKLLRHKKDRKKGWINVAQNGDLAFDGFIGNGVVELIRYEGNNPMPPRVLRLDLSKESITPKEVKKEPTIGTPGANMGGGVIVNDMPMGNAPGSEAYIAASTELPF